MKAQLKNEISSLLNDTGEEPGPHVLIYKGGNYFELINNEKIPYHKKIKKDCHILCLEGDTPKGVGNCLILENEKILFKIACVLNM